ncbi:hypothetical protein, partial [Streptomyces sp. SID5643]|uniref:hypothetical protein n=1 Tax=Streptomyces sp. SID5643 TaxID=2690307 RepID=UPI001F3BBA10
SRFMSSGVDGLLGKIENHALFVYHCALIFYLLQNSNGFAEIKTEHTIGSAPKVREPQLYIVEKLQDL